MPIRPVVTSLSELCPDPERAFQQGVGVWAMPEGFPIVVGSGAGAGVAVASGSRVSGGNAGVAATSLEVDASVGLATGVATVQANRTARNKGTVQVKGFNILVSWPVVLYRVFSERLFERMEGGVVFPRDGLAGVSMQHDEQGVNQRAQHARRKEDGRMFNHVLTALFPEVPRVGDGVVSQITEQGVCRLRNIPGPFELAEKNFPIFPFYRSPLLPWEVPEEFVQVVVASVFSSGLIESVFEEHLCDVEANDLFPYAEAHSSGVVGPMRKVGLKEGEQSFHPHDVWFP